MNLEELKKSLASEATEKSAKLEAEIKRLKKELCKRDEKIQAQKDMMRPLFNRCATLTGGGLCIFCDMREACESTRSVYKQPAEVET